MKNIIAILLLSLNLLVVKAEEDKPSIYKMWSRGEGIKNFVFDIEKDSVTLNFSEKDKWSASDIKAYGFISFTEKGDGGRLIVRRDSLGIEHFRTIDITGLTLDSLKLFLHPEYFADQNQAGSAQVKKPSDLKSFFTTEYLYLKKVEEKAPTLKKADYINFLKDAQVEAKKRATEKTIVADPKKPIDKRIEEFLYAFAKEKKYRGKIFPNNLEKAIKVNAKDENVKKIMASIKTSFVVKKTNETELSKDTKGKTPASKVDPKGKTPAAKADAKGTSKKEKPSNDLIIKTEN
jgi:hypothetical protein